MPAGTVDEFPPRRPGVEHARAAGALRLRDVSRRRDEFAELPDGHRMDVEQERLHVGDERRRLGRRTAVRANARVPAGKRDHAGNGDHARRSAAGTTRDRDRETGGREHGRGRE